MERMNAGLVSGGIPEREMVGIELSVGEMLERERLTRT